MATEPNFLRQLFGDRAAELEQGGGPERHIFVHDTPARFPEALRTGELSTFHKLAQVYQGTLFQAGGEGDDYRMIRVQGAPPIDLVRIGLTVQFNNLLPSVRSVRPLQAQLGAALGLPPSLIRFTAWISPHAAGLEPHYDENDAIIVQVAGEKRWRIGPNTDIQNPVRAWSRRQPFDSLDPMAFENGVVPKSYPENLEPVDLKPGSVLYVPGGYWHATEASGESYSLSIRLHVPIVAEMVVKQLAYTLVRDPKWRERLRGAWGGPAARERAKAFVEERVRALSPSMPQVSAETVLAFSTEEADLQFLYVSSETLLYRPWTRKWSIELKGDGPGLILAIRDTFSGNIDRTELAPVFREAAEWMAQVDGYFKVADVEERAASMEAETVKAFLQELVARGALFLVPTARS